jgi:glycosyltransferase domain-containing protein
MDDAPRNKITILVNVHNRHRHLARQLDYIHDHYDRILVCDSSDAEYAGKNDYPNVEYFYYPHWEYVDKLADIVKKVETPYVHLCADDDFYFPKSIEACVNFLISNPDYASAQGQYVSFHWNGKHFNIAPMYRNLAGRDICGSDVSDRLIEVFRPYVQMLYAVHHTDNLRQCFIRAGTNGITNHRLVELLVSIIAIINGGHKVLPLLYGVRETLFNSAGTHVASIDDILKQESLKEEFNRYQKLIAVYLNHKLGIPEKHAVGVFQEAFCAYINNPKRTLRRLPHRLPASLRILFNHCRYSIHIRKSLNSAEQAMLSTVEERVRKHNC